MIDWPLSIGGETPTAGAVVGVTSGETVSARGGGTLTVTLTQALAAGTPGLSSVSSAEYAVVATGETVRDEAVWPAIALADAHADPVYHW